MAAMANQNFPMDYQTIKKLKEEIKVYTHKYHFKMLHVSLSFQKTMNV